MITLDTELLTKKELADALGVSPRTIERMVAMNAIPHVRMKAFTGRGRRVRFDKAAINAWFAARVNNTSN